MTMASRDIANMHLFLDLKKKFPDLLDDTLRSYISMYAEDQDKCISLLQKESENHYHPSQPFSDFRLPDSKVNPRKSNNLKSVSSNESAYSSLCQSSLQQLDVLASTTKVQVPSGRSKSHAGVVHLPKKAAGICIPYKPESYSAPVMESGEKPFHHSKQTPISSQTTLCQVPNNKNDCNQMIFSTTKEHIILPPVSHESRAYLPISTESELLKKHAVKMNITPSFPFPQQHANAFSNSVCAAATHTSRPGRHMTSLNFQLQSQSSNQYPLEISTIPTNVGHLCDSRDFGSHVQISVGSQGTALTAFRIQRPNYSTNTSQFSAGQESCDFSPSSQAPISASCMLPTERMQSLSCSGNIPFTYSQEQEGLYGGQSDYIPKNTNIQYGSLQSYQSSPDYILAVKNHQIAQLDLILSELEKEKSLCSNLKAEINQMEQEIAQRNASFPYAEELSKLREENQKLRIECNCMWMEQVNINSRNQIPLGVTDEDFYSNIFTGPNSTIASSASKAASPAHREKLSNKSKHKSSFEDDEQNRWECKKCTFANHPALEKCEMCEMPKSSEFVEYNSDYSTGTCLRFVSSPKNQPRRAVGSVQISVTRRVPASSNSVKLHLTHNIPR